MNHPLRKTLIVIIILALIAAGFIWHFHRPGKTAYSYRTASIKRGELVAAIGATGTLEPEELVDVGAQVAGQINTFGQDKNGKTIDYGSIVEEGMILARIDDSVYAAQVSQDTAQLHLAQAGIRKAQADLEQTQAKLRQAQRDWDRAEKLGPSEALAQSSYDGYKSAYEIAQANVLVSQAALEQAQFSVESAEAVLKRSQRNLNFCTIRSPVNGVIIDRRVNIGQTVVASLNAPSLFLIAKDLTHMQIWVPVNEADIGHIKIGQPVEFTVETFPDQVFSGKVGKIRMNATMTQNVVTYVVEVDFDNTGGRLLPYLTANVSFETGRRDNVLRVPNAALRWSPLPEQIAPAFRPQDQEASATTRTPHPEQRRKNGAEMRTSGTLWVQENQYVQPLEVKIGLTDGSMTEVEGKDLREDMEVIVGQAVEASKDPDTTKNPFAPQPFRGSRPPR